MVLQRWSAKEHGPYILVAVHAKRLDLGHSLVPVNVLEQRSVCRRILGVALLLVEQGSVGHRLCEPEVVVLCLGHGLIQTAYKVSDGESGCELNE